MNTARIQLNPIARDQVTESDLNKTGGESSNSRTSKRLLFRGTIAVSLIEWLLFELLRTPYAPPGSMLTLLGTEKYAVVGIVFCLAGIWVICAMVILVNSNLTIRELMSFVGMLCVIMAFYLFIIKNPLRYVTPWELMWS